MPDLEPGDNVYSWGTAASVTQPAGMSAVHIECNGMAGSPIPTEALGGKSTGILPLAPGGVIYVRAGVEDVTVGGAAVSRSADVRYGGTDLAHRVIVAGGAAADHTSGGVIDVYGGVGGGDAGGDGNGPNGGAGGTQTSGYQLGLGEPAGNKSGGCGYWGGRAGGAGSSTGGGGSSFGSTLLYEYETIPGGASLSDGYDRMVVLTPIPNLAPNAPILTSVAALAYDQPYTFRWAFSDDQAWDRQSAYRFRAKLTTDTSWTVDSGWVAQPLERHLVAADTFTAGSWEWQVATRDNYGGEGAFSSSSFFTAVASPAGPVYTAPADGATLSLPGQTVTFTADADSWQFRIVADDAGTADTGTVYYDTGEVLSAERSLSFNLDTDTTTPLNGLTIHYQLRGKKSGVWSDWIDQTHPVSYSPPPTPTFTLSPANDLGLLYVVIANPASGVGVPDTSYNEVWRDDGDGAGLVRIATNVPPSSTYVYSTPVSGRDYGHGALQVRAIGANGSTATAEEPT